MTNDAGLYRVGNLVPGSYRIAVEGDGFTPGARGPVTLAVGQTIAIDITLEVGQQSQTIEVTEAAGGTDRFGIGGAEPVGYAGVELGRFAR